MDGKEAGAALSVGVLVLAVVLVRMGGTARAIGAAAVAALYLGVLGAMLVAEVRGRSRSSGAGGPDVLVGAMDAWIRSD
ncbi:MAG: hypothetical protein ABEH40_08970 [Haloferacaceae archaeon]